MNRPNFLRSNSNPDLKPFIEKFKIIHEQVLQSSYLRDPNTKISLLSYELLLLANMLDQILEME